MEQNFGPHMEQERPPASPWPSRALWDSLVSCDRLNRIKWLKDHHMTPRSDRRTATCQNTAWSFVGTVGE
jgi:hypothetical protein